MSHTQKLMIAVLGFFAVGFIMVGMNETQTQEQQESAAMIRSLAGMQSMASKKCPALIKKHTGSQVDTLVSRTDSDRASYLTLEWLGEANDNFKKATCTLTVARGGVSTLVIDGKTVINKDF